MKSQKEFRNWAKLISEDLPELKLSGEVNWVFKLLGWKKNVRAKRSR